ncbi:hypothetical protein NBRC116493_10370 [Aurantivibrio infirmus]
MIAADFRNCYVFKPMSLAIFAVVINFCGAGTVFGCGINHRSLNMECSKIAILADFVTSEPVPITFDDDAVVDDAMPNIVIF